MERLTKWWRSRQQARVSTDTNEFSRIGVRFLVVFFAILVLLSLIWGLLLGGRWVYRKFDNKPADNAQTQPQDNKEPSGIDISGESDSMVEEPREEPAETPSPAPAPAPSPQPSTPPTTPVPPTTVPRTGPEE